ncbi:MAG: hypothetical protein Q9159_006852 [Coniocarpon cinnabarinum]
MKGTVFSLTAVSLLQYANAQPAHIANHARQHVKRDVVTQTEIVTAATPDVMVYVNQNGEPISTAYASAPTAQAQSAPAPAPAAPSESAPQRVSAQAAPSEYGGAPEQSSHEASAPSSHAQPAPSSYAPAPSSYSAPAPPASSAPSAPSASASSSSAPAPSHSSPSSQGPSGGDSLGINYSPYHTDHSCKTSDEVMKDIQALPDYGVVRSYGTDCNQVPNMINAAKSKNMKIMLGVYDVTQAANEAGMIVSGIKAAAGGDWSMVHSISVGNEAVNSGQASVGQVLSGLQTAKGTLKAGGYSGPVVTVDTFDALIAHPELCQASDYAAANAHAFFDATSSADQAGKWAQGTAQRVKDACGGKNVILTESGWPSQGSPNGAAVPSKEAQSTAISSLKSAFPNGGLFLFSAYNDAWKDDFSGSFGCEKYWGIYGSSSH